MSGGRRQQQQGAAEQQLPCWRALTAWWLLIAWAAVSLCCPADGPSGALSLLFGTADDMAPRYRHSLQEKLETHAPAFRMSDVTFKSFQLQVRTSCTAAAAAAW